MLSLMTHEIPEKRSFGIEPREIDAAHPYEDLPDPFGRFPLIVLRYY
jgi:hypothetical protein